MGRPKSHKSLYAEVVDGRGTGLAVPVERGLSAEKGGYAPERLDPVIQMLISNAEGGINLLNTYSPMLVSLLSELQRQVQTLIEGKTPADANQGVDDPALETLVHLVDQLTRALERVNKMVLNAVRAKDDATRLRSFLAGDQDRGDLSNLSENELRRMIMDAATGWYKPENGTPRG